MSDGPPVLLATLEESAALARDALRRAPPGSLLLLSGPLGAGKTTFTSLLAAALGSAADVSSPTYTLVHEYPTPEGPLVHIDAYRLPDPTALTGLGLDDYLARARLVVVEWGAPLAALYPDALVLEFALEPHGEQGVRRSARWRRGAPGASRPGRPGGAP
ncbi:MAG: tRNA (adenosine(37)-N6)-threonylcarbamoyltransferase complex ATPase subunit type 1 TsaE [Deinococcales bacterium]|nr:tRNA (adenosine(37)-N6)-threonylcarbamoyltransferase complex ATPase subunit type 1 TsaE [Deinococcales bacterium]